MAGYTQVGSLAKFPVLLFRDVFQILYRLVGHVGSLLCITRMVTGAREMREYINELHHEKESH